MTDYFVGPGGLDANSGLTWLLRKLTINSLDVGFLLQPGDDAYIGPGTYRELPVLQTSGGNVYAAGTVTVTNASTTVTGVGTAFVANVSIADMFHVQFFATGNDGVANGTPLFTSAAGNFQANMIGKVIQIAARNSYVIGAVAAANSITLTDVNGVGFPAAGANLVYSVMSGEGPYEIDSITDNTNFELVRAWCGPTLTGLAYITYEPIRYIGDVTGEMTDGVGGIIRVTASDNDQTSVRANAITGANSDYKILRNIWFDMGTSHVYYFPRLASTHVTTEDCVFQAPTGGADLARMISSDVGTFRRCVFLGTQATGLFLVTCGDDSGIVIENCLFASAWRHISTHTTGGVTIKDCTFIGSRAIGIVAAATAGQAVVVNNCILYACEDGLRALALGEIVEDFNDFFNNTNARINTATGTNSLTYPPLFQLPILPAGFKFPWWLSELSEWSQIAGITGFQAACHDLRGFARPATAAKKSWGSTQYTNAERDTGTVYAGSASYELLDAGRVQFKVPCTNRSYMVRVRVQREANYAGTNPQIIIKQHGQADRTTTDVGAAGAWNLLEDTFIPAADPEYFFVELVSNNTAVAGNYATFFDALEIRGEPQNPGEFEHWMWDRQPFETLPANPLVVRGREYRRRRMPGPVSAMDEQ